MFIIIHFIIHPQLYFGYGVMNMVWNHIDHDTATADTLQRVDVSFLNSTNPTEAYPINEQDSAGYINYFLAQCPNGITNLHGNGSLLFTDVYSDIDAIYSSNNSGIKLTFICNPGSTATEIGLEFEGQTTLSITNNWELVVHTLVGDYIFNKPRVYQLDTSGNRIPVSWNLSWNIPQSGQANFNGWNTYDGSKTLVIEISNAPSQNINYDPGLCWSTYFGGSNRDFSYAITGDSLHNRYITGFTESFNFPHFAGLFPSSNGSEKVFISKFDINNKQIWSTFYGGLGGQQAFDVKCKSNGDIYFCGYVDTASFILVQHSGSFIDTSFNGTNDGFIACLNSSGTAVKWSAYIGSIANDQMYSLDFDMYNNLFVIGTVQLNDSNVPIAHPTGYYYQNYSGSQDAFICKFNDNDSLIWSTYYGGSNDDIAYSLKIDQSNNLVVQGLTNSFDFSYTYSSQGSFIDSVLDGPSDDFIIKFDSTGHRKWSTYVGGSDYEFVTGTIFFAGTPHRLAFDTEGNLFLVGCTYSDDFPLKNSGGFFDSTFANRDGYIMKFNESNDSLLWSTYISGAGAVQLNSIVIDEDNKIFCAGSTSDPNFWIQPYGGVYYQPSLLGSGSPINDDGCIIVFDNNLNLIYGSYFGGNEPHNVNGEQILGLYKDGESLFLTGFKCVWNTWQ